MAHGEPKIVLWLESSHPMMGINIEELEQPSIAKQRPSTKFGRLSQISRCVPN